ncbi:unnamed protein product, partial [Nesidiocoris tenuis]
MQYALQYIHYFKIYLNNTPRYNRSKECFRFEIIGKSAFNIIPKFGMFESKINNQ